MKNRILRMKAIRALPEKWVHGDTRMVVDEKCAYVANPNFPAMVYENDIWSNINSDEERAKCKYLKWSRARLNGLRQN